MAIRKILTIADPVLYQKSEPVTKFDRDLRSLARDMYDTLYDAAGAGLAAVQIGILKRIIVIDLEERGYMKGVFINPEIVKTSKETQLSEEGCLSVPGLSIPLARPQWVRVRYQNLNGEWKEAEGDGIFARALMHETDHMDGKIYIDLLEPDMRLSHEKEIEIIKKGGSVPQASGN